VSGAPGSLHDACAAGIPDPLSIERQKSAYSKGLDDQLKHGAGLLQP